MLHTDSPAFASKQHGFGCGHDALAHVVPIPCHAPFMSVSHFSFDITSAQLFVPVLVAQHAPVVAGAHLSGPPQVASALGVEPASQPMPTVVCVHWLPEQQYCLGAGAQTPLHPSLVYSVPVALHVTPGAPFVAHWFPVVQQ
jgi:hypothetical protein